MSILPETLARTRQLLVRAPGVWLFGLLIALLGWSNLPIAVFAAAVRSSESPVGRGAGGWLVLVGVAMIAIVLEVAMVRTMAGAEAERGRPLAALGSAIQQIGRVGGLLGALAVTGVGIELALSAPLWWVFGSLAGTVLNFFTLGFATLGVIALTSLGLFIPVWIVLPLAVRAVALGRRGAWEAILDSLYLAAEGFGLVVLCFLVSLGLNLAVFALGLLTAARDLALPALLGVVAEWPGANTASGGVLLLLTAVVVAVQVALWTAAYEALAHPLKLDQAATAEYTPASDETRQTARWLLMQARRTLAALRQAPGLLVLGAVIAFLGVWSPTDLFLALTNLLPGAGQSANGQVADSALAALPANGPVLIGLVLGGFVLSLLCSTALVVATERALNLGSVDLRAALALGARRLPRVLAAEVRWFGLMVLIGGTLLFVVLLGMALLVDVAPGLDALADSVDALIAFVAGAACLVGIPFVARAVLIEGRRPGEAIGRAATVAFARPAPALLVFLLAFGLDLLKGPLAARLGLLTNGWADLLALLGWRAGDPPIGSAALIGSLTLFLLAVAIVAFKALLWTQLYVAAAPEQVASAPAPAAKRGRRRPRRPRPDPTPGAV